MSPFFSMISQIELLQPLYHHDINRFNLSLLIVSAENGSFYSFLFIPNDSKRRLVFHGSNLSMNDRVVIIDYIGLGFFLNILQFFYSLCVIYLVIYIYIFTQQVSCSLMHCLLLIKNSLITHCVQDIALHIAFEYDRTHQRTNYSSMLDCTYHHWYIK